MASVYVTIGSFGARGNFGDHAVISAPFVSEIVTSSSSSAVSTATAPNGGRSVAKVVCATAIYAAPGPTVSATTGIFIPGGVPEYIALQAGQAVAVIDA
jgi:hypothetical protein